MSLLPPQQPKFSSPGNPAPNSAADWLVLQRYLNQLTTYLTNIAGNQVTFLPGSVSGTAALNQPLQGAGFSIVSVFLQNLTGNATFAFPAPFANQPGIFPAVGLTVANVAGLSTTEITITGAGSTGWIILMGS